MIRRHITAPAVSVPSGTPIERVAKALLDCEGRQLPVMLEGHPIGVVRQETVDDQGELRDGAWYAFGPATTAHDVTTEAPILHTDALEDAMRALLVDTVAVICSSEGVLLGVFTEHDGVRAALEHLPDGLPALAVASTPVWSIDRGERADRADALMQRHQLRHIVLTDQGRAVGVLSLRDLISQGVRRGRNVPSEQLWQRRPLLSLPADARLRDAANVLVDERIGALPLLDADGRAVAVLTRRDVVRAALDHAWAR